MQEDTLKMTPLIVSFYTVGTPYEQEVENLRRSLVSFNLRYSIEGVPNLGSWMLNTHHTPTFIKRMLDAAGCPVIYLDADSVVLRYPHEFYTVPNDVDFGCCYFNWPKRRPELSGAVLYFSQSKLSHRILDEWIEANKDMSTRNALHLAKVVESEEIQHSIKMKIFPVEYDCIFDKHAGIENPVIKQFQASRRFRKTLGPTPAANQKLKFLGQEIKGVRDRLE
jgi:hypothetical protein